jgi:hypothetical protein
MPAKKQSLSSSHVVRPPHRNTCTLTQPSPLSLALSSLHFNRALFQCIHLPAERANLCASSVAVSLSKQRRTAPQLRCTPHTCPRALRTMSFLFGRNRQKTPQELVRALKDSVIRPDTPLEKRRVRRRLVRKPRCSDMLLSE